MPDTSVAPETVKGTAGIRWSASEDNSLRIAVANQRATVQHKAAASGMHSSAANVKIDWELVASEVAGGGKRTAKQCEVRWERVVSKGWIKGPWTPEEDEMILKCIAQNITRWSDIAACIPGRVGKQCRERYHNHLDPSINKGPWTPEEDAILLKAVEEMGTRWTSISQQLKGRSENTVKNRWNSIIRRRNFNSAGLQSHTFGKLLMNAKRSVSNKRAAAMRGSRASEVISDREGDRTSPTAEYSEDSTSQNAHQTRIRTRGKRGRRHLEDDASDDEYVLPGGSGTVSAPRRSSRASAKQNMRYGISDQAYDSGDDFEEEEHHASFEDFQADFVRTDQNFTTARYMPRLQENESAFSTSTGTPDAFMDPNFNAPVPIPLVRHSIQNSVQSIQTISRPIDYRLSEQMYNHNDSKNSSQTGNPNRSQNGDAISFSRNHSPSGGESIEFNYPLHSNVKPSANNDSSSLHDISMQPLDSKFDSRVTDPANNRSHTNTFGTIPQHRHSTYPSNYHINGNVSLPQENQGMSSTDKTSFPELPRVDFSPSIDTMMNSSQTRYILGRDNLNYRPDYGMIQHPPNSDYPPIHFVSRIPTPVPHPSEWNNENPPVPSVSHSMGFVPPYLGYHNQKQPYSMKPLQFPSSNNPVAPFGGHMNSNIYGGEESLPPHSAQIPHSPYIPMHPSGYTAHHRIVPTASRGMTQRNHGSFYSFPSISSAVHTPQRPLSHTSQSPATMSSHFQVSGPQALEHSTQAYKLGDISASPEFLKDRSYALQPYSSISRHPSPLGSPSRHSDPVTHSSPIRESYHKEGHVSKNPVKLEVIQPDKVSGNDANTTASVSSSSENAGTGVAKFPFHEKISLGDLISVEDKDHLGVDKSSQESVFTNVVASKIPNLSMSLTPPSVSPANIRPPEIRSEPHHPYFYNSLSTSFPESTYPTAEHESATRSKESLEVVPNSIVALDNPTLSTCITTQPSLRGELLEPVEVEGTTNNKNTLEIDKVHAPTADDLSEITIASEPKPPQSDASMLPVLKSEESYNSESRKSPDLRNEKAIISGAVAPSEVVGSTILPLSSSNGSIQITSQAKLKPNDGFQTDSKSSRPHVDLTLLQPGPFDAHPRWSSALDQPPMMNMFMSAYSPMSANTPMSFSRPTSPPTQVLDKGQRPPYWGSVPSNIHYYSRAGYPYASAGSPHADESYVSLDHQYHASVSPAPGHSKNYHATSQHPINTEMRDHHRQQVNAFGFAPVTIDRTVSPYNPTHPPSYMPNHTQNVLRHQQGPNMFHHAGYHPHSKLNSNFIEPGYDMDKLNQTTKGSTFEFSYSRAPSPNLSSQNEESAQRTSMNPSMKSDTLSTVEKTQITGKDNQMIGGTNFDRGLGYTVPTTNSPASNPDLLQHSSEIVTESPTATFSE